MKINELLVGIKRKDIVVPEFQREYVWSREQAKQLLVSLYKNYPVGSLLFWKTDNPPVVKNIDVNKKRIKNFIIAISEVLIFPFIRLFTTCKNGAVF